VRAVVLVHGVALVVSACAPARFDVLEVQQPEELYTSVFPTYAEFCAVSEIKKKHGHGVEIVGGGPGGHTVLYLNGACRVPDAGYPTIAVCDQATAPEEGQGVGISVNAHFRNANWVATPGRDFFFRGEVAPGEGLTEAAYLETQARAQRLGILDGIVFHEHVFDAKPAEMSRLDYMYEVTVATDYAIAFGRDRYCVRLPLDRGELATVVDFLNAANEPYRTGRQVFEWNVLKNNCSHLAHNALAELHLWRRWPTERPLLISAFDFPVPKNELVDLLRITNDRPLPKPTTLYRNRTARSALEQDNRVRGGPGALTETERVLRPNVHYDTDLELIFYDVPPFSRYHQRFQRFFTEKRYTDLGENLRSFEARYRALLAMPSPPGAQASEDFAAFSSLYQRYLTKQVETIDRFLAGRSTAR
jgi:hypothetical protein